MASPKVSFAERFHISYSIVLLTSQYTESQVHHSSAVINKNFVDMDNIKVLHIIMSLAKEFGDSSPRQSTSLPPQPHPWHPLEVTASAV